ncbi:MAG: hypothetical protein K2N94_05375 [Lachnospiraceae bacterium]|nr:hypothetical protein [Lachnospiraceae bacterium]
MTYEIRKKNNTRLGEPDSWFPIAWTDLRVWAEKIADSLRVFEDGEFGVFTSDMPGDAKPLEEGWYRK